MNQLVAVLLVTQLLSTSYLLALLYKTRQEVADARSDAEKAHTLAAALTRRTSRILQYQPTAGTSQKSEADDYFAKERTAPLEI